MTEEQVKHAMALVDRFAELSVDCILEFERGNPRNIPATEISRDAARQSLETYLLAMEDESDKRPAHIEPPQRPVTILDMERSGCTPGMDDPMADPCPRCGGFRLRVGDWVCWRTCYPCFRSFVRKDS